MIKSKEDGRRSEVDNLIPQVRDFVEETSAKINSGEIKETGYGHASGVMVAVLRDMAYLGKPEEEQVKFLRESALKMIRQHGPEIIDFMREELRLALTAEDLEFLGL